MELVKRLRLGKLAGGLEIKGQVKLQDGTEASLSPLGAAMVGHHDRCVEVIEDALRAAGAEPVPDGWTALRIEGGGVIFERADGHLTRIKPTELFLAGIPRQYDLGLLAEGCELGGETLG